MTQPRMIRAHATYVIERRIERRRFLLRPDEKLTRLFTWVLCISAEEFDVQIHVATVMSTHFHMVVTVPNEDVSDFMHRLDLRLAKALQVLRRFAHGVVWEPGKLSIVELCTPSAIIEQIAYTIVNPVKAGLVHSSRDWPGLTATVQDIGERVLHAVKPDWYFGAEHWPEEGSAPLLMPEWLMELYGLEQARTLLAEEVANQEAAARAEAKANGWTILGPIAAKNTSPYQRAKSWLDFRRLNPHIAAGRGQTAVRIAEIQRIRTFRANHRESKQLWCAGDRAVVFPAGTYWMRIHHGATVEPFD